MSLAVQHTRIIIEWAFDNCNRFTSMVIPDNVFAIGRMAFDGCDSLTSVVIGENVTTIGDMVFSDCPALASVEFRCVDGWKATDINGNTYNTSFANKEKNAKHLTASNYYLYATLTRAVE